MKCVSVILDIPTQALDTPYTYQVPDALRETAQVGCAVAVPFGGRKAIGYIVGTELVPDGLDDRKLKPIEQVASEPFFDETGAECAQWLAKHYVAPLSSCIKLFTPPGASPRMVRGKDGWRVEAPQIGEVDDRWVLPGPSFREFEPKKNAVKQIAIMKTLQAGEVRVAELAAEFGAVHAALKALEKQGAVRIEHRRRLRGVDTPAAFEPTPKPSLTEGQANALRVIDEVAVRGAGEVVLLDGVTGSGKTEVYLQAIERVIERGRTACVLVPEISLTPQTVARFRGRFGDTVAVMHSRMSRGERYDQWGFIRSGEAKVVVGARSALFTPLRNLGIIVIDEEHEGSYKQDQSPRYVSRDVAVRMARRAGAAVVLGSATPSLQALYNCDTDPNWHRCILPERANRRTMPEISVVDMTREFKSGSRSMFSRALTDALHEELAAGRKAVLLLNQRGFAQFVLCRDCGFVPECDSCSTSLTFHERGNMLMCHHCGHREELMVVCPRCGSPYIRKFGAGTQRVEDELAALLRSFGDEASEAVIVRMDADTTSAKGAHQRLLEEFAAADRAVLLGTQMIAKGLDFDDVTVVGVINADTMLKLPDFRAGERTFDLIEQVAGRAGRAELTGRVYVQTYEADAASIRAAATYNRARFLADEMPKRELLGYPPYVRMANILAWGKDDRAVRRVIGELHAELRGQLDADAVSMTAPTPCVLSRLRGMYRWHVVVKAPLGFDLSAALESFFRTRKPDALVNVAVDIDPDSML